MEKPEFSATEVSLIALFAALTAIGGFIRVPIPYIPLTLQTLMVMFSGLLLGGKMAALSQLIYILIGLIGLPVFAYGGGPGYVLQPTFGYLVGFIPGAYVLGKLTENRKPLTRTSVALAVGVCLITIYFFGTLYLYLNINFIQQKSLRMLTALKIGCILPLPTDVLKLVLVMAIGPELKKRLHPFLPTTNLPVPKSTLKSISSQSPPGESTLKLKGLMCQKKENSTTFSVSCLP